MQNNKEIPMDTGKIFLGIALIAFSAAMVINPASAAGCDNSCQVGCGDFHTAECISAAGLLQDSDYTAYSAVSASTRIIPGNLP
jgi:hypothetical protein